jgi:hypothetical protein
MKDLSLEKRKRIKQLRQYSFDYSKNNKAKKIQKDLSSSINTSLDCKNFGKSFLKPDYAIEKSYSFWNHDINKDVKKLLLNSHNIKNKIFQRNSCKKKSMSSSNIYDSNSNCIFPYHSCQNSFRNNKKYKNNSQYKLDILKKKMNEKNFSIDKKKKKYLNNKNNDTITILNYRNKIISNSFSKSNITNFHHYNFKNENNSLLNIFKQGSKNSLFEKIYLNKNYYFNTMKKS